MSQPLSTFIRHWGMRIANLGITESLSFQEKNKTRVLNIAVATGIPLNFFFSVYNFLQDKPLLAAINFLLGVGGVAILYINSRRRFLLGRLILSFLASFVFFIGAILFRNGTEYSIVAVMVITIIFFNERKFIIFLTIINCLLFIGIKLILLSSFYYDSVPSSRIIFNIAWSLGIIVISLMYVKYEQENHQKQIEKNNWELENMNSTKEKLFSIIAHDLRSPIGQLKTLLDLVNGQQISMDKFKQLTATIAREVDQLHGTMDSLLKWSANQSQGINTVPEKIELRTILQDTLVFFSQKTEQKHLRLLIEESGVFVWADRDQLQIIIRNLISNACKYSNPGAIIMIRAFNRANDVLIQVIDQGTGMPEELGNSVFYNADIVSTSGTAGERGTGLGLKLCKEFVEKNLGTIWVESELGKGSTFSLTLPKKMPGT